MKIGVLSDSHDHLDRLAAALRRFERAGVRLVIHAGDIVAPFAAKRLATCPVPLHVIYGNNDGEREGLKSVLPQIQDGPVDLSIEGRRICVAHFIAEVSKERIGQYEVIISGHTHEAVNQTVDGTLLLNPGECCGWVKGKATAAVLDTVTLKAEIIDLD